jgi:hypothetical protein
MGMTDDALPLGGGPLEAPIDVERAALILVDVLELAEALPYSPKEGPAPLRLPKSTDEDGDGR